MLTAARSLRPIRLLVALLGAIALITGACGDDDSGGAAMSDDEFCEMLADMEDEVDDLDDPEAFALLGEVARQAPNAELREAMITIAEIAEEFEDLDEDDPAAMMAVFALFGDAEFMEAAETIDRYMTEVCGFDTGSDFDDDFFDDDFGDDDFDDDFDSDGADSGWGGTGPAMDDMSAGDVVEALGSAFDDFAPDNRGSGVGIYPNFGGAGTIVDATVYDAPEVDGVALCEALDAAVASLTDDPDVRLEIFSDETLVAERDLGGSCVPA